MEDKAMYRQLVVCRSDGNDWDVIETNICQ